MSEWKEHKLGDLIDVKHGFAFKGECITTEPTSNILVTPGNFNIGGGFKVTKFKYYYGQYPESYILKEGDVVVTMTDLSQEGDTLGYSAKIPKQDGFKFLHNQRIGLVNIISDEADKEFIYWTMRTYEYQGFIVGAATGTSIRHTSPITIKEYTFQLPPLPEQKSIASILSSLDDKIDLLHRQNKTLEALAGTLFRQWFVEEAEESWEEKSLVEIAEYLNGLALQKFTAKGIDDLPVIKIREMKQGISENTDKCSRDIPSQYIIHDGDILFSWSGSLEVVIWHDGEGALNQHLFKVSSDKYPKWFYYLATKYHLANFKMIAETKSTTMGHIQREHLREAIILIPPKELFAEYDKKIAPLIEKKIKNNNQIRTLTQLRDTLLPKLMSGDVRVGN